MGDSFSYAEASGEKNSIDGQDPGKGPTLPDIKGDDTDISQSGFDTALFRDLLNTSPVGFYLTNTDTGEILFFNESFCLMWHLEEIGDAMRSGKAKDSEVLAFLKQGVAEATEFLDTWEPLQHRENPAIVYKELRLADGRLVELFSTQVRDDRGNFQGRLFIFEDITQKRTTIELTAANHRLVEENERRTALLDDLQEKQSLLARAEQIARLGSWTLDMLNRKAIYSQELARILDLPPGQEAVDFSVMLKAIHPEDLDRFLIWTKASMKKHNVDRIDFRIVRSNGACRFIHCEVEYEFNEDNKPVRMFGTIQDMTEIMEARSRLKRMTETEMLVLDISRRLMHLSSQDTDAEVRRALMTIGLSAGADRSYVFLMSGDGTRMDNTHEWRAEGMTNSGDRGIRIDQLPWMFGRLKMFGAINIPAVDRMPDAARQELGRLLPDGARSAVIAPMIYSGTLIGLIGFDSFREERAWSADDATLLKLVGSILTSALIRKGSEIAISESETRLRLITGSAGFPMLICDGEKITYANAAAGKISGYTSGELESMSLFELIHPEYYEMIRNRLSSRLRGGKVPSKYDLKFIRKDGAERWLEAFVERGELDGRPVIIVSGTDITERKNEELELKRALAEKDLQIKRLSAGHKPQKK